MGFFLDDRPGHEGYAVGFVVRDGCEGSELYRELLYPADSGGRQVARISAGCDCGWRSPHLRPDRLTEWVPFGVVASAADLERIYKLWAEHVGGAP